MPTDVLMPAPVNAIVWRDAASRRAISAHFFAIASASSSYSVMALKSTVSAMSCCADQ
jgi:hypothetical protein